jgi:sugar phosphate isomerase/epimerase
VDFHSFINKVANLGFDILAVNGGTIARMTGDERRRLKPHSDERSIAMTYCIGLTNENDLASEDRLVRERGIAFLQQQAWAIGEVGGGWLSGIVYSSSPAHHA